MAKSENGNYLPMSEVVKRLHTSSSTIIRLSNSANPPLDTMGNMIAKKELRRLKKLIPKHFEELKQNARKLHSEENQPQGS